MKMKVKMESARYATLDRWTRTVQAVGTTPEGDDLWVCRNLAEDWTAYLNGVHIGFPKSTCTFFGIIPRASFVLDGKDVPCSPGAYEVEVNLTDLLAFFGTDLIEARKKVKDLTSLRPTPL